MARRVGRSVSFADSGVYITWLADEKELQETLRSGIPDIFSPSMGFEEWEP